MTATTTDPRTPGVSWLDRAVRRSMTTPGWVGALTVAAGLAGCWLLVHASGGTVLSTPHLFYVPIVLATLPFGVRGSVVTALAATLLCGPLMPLDVATGEHQDPASWLVRGAMFVAVGCVAALALQLRQREYERQLRTELRTEIREAIAPVRERSAEAERLARQVDDVVDGRRFHLVYQPIYAFADGRLLAVEALTRVDVEPLRPPDVWFAAAHEAGRGTELELLAIEAALEGTRGLPLDVDVAVNASPGTLASPRLHALLERSQRTVVVEITEHAMVEDYPLLRDAVAALRDRGAKIAVDDAGAGFASLRHVLQLAPDTIKLDMSLTQDLALSPLRRALGGALIEFAHATGARLVVEGIEDVADLGAWHALGAEAVQGYAVGRPGALPPAPTSPQVMALHGRGVDGRIPRQARR
ncbi:MULTISPECIES: EAL domain-containing protein [unclassified Actinotalea]|uniref:EAL domain-containing protein n=1 Tax=unclassified Actinotalea TaxID=2638618 RepID=UPI0015F4472A|nr:MULTISPECIES: EAL domain-containing protein [unclassified Actinotalea]